MNLNSFIFCWGEVIFLMSSYEIKSDLFIRDEDIQMTAVRSQGPGGQNVNKVSSAVHLRFNIFESDLPEGIKKRLLTIGDKRISSLGVILIKAQNHRTFHRNKEEAIERLVSLIKNASIIPKRRRATKKTFSSQKRRLESKKKRGKVKSLRKSVDF